MHHILVVAFQALILHLLLLSSATRLPLLHRDDDHSLSSPHDDYGHRFEARMKRDAMRVASLTRLLAANEASGFETGLLFNNEYFAEVGVGTPPQNLTLHIDTGSDLLWVNCQCDLCNKQFDPKSSTSFADVGCDDSTCYKVDASDRGCDSDRCTYNFIYADETETNGTMAMESITIGNTTVQNVPIGCSHLSGGVGGADGILALGGGSVSYASQSGGLIGGVFSYCLGTSTTGGGWLGFGLANVPTSNVAWASLITNPKHPSYYYIDVEGISVGGEVLDIPADTFQLNPDTGEGGVIIDTGTSVTRLVQGAYEALREKFKAKMGNLPTVDGFGIFDTCYNLQGYDDLGSVDVPAVLFSISSRGMDLPTIALEAKNVLLEVDISSVTYCLAFASTGQNLNILGNMQQQGTQITIEATSGYVGFGPGDC